jgi:hypothetical protein
LLYDLSAILGGIGIEESDDVIADGPVGDNTFSLDGPLCPEVAFGEGGLYGGAEVGVSLKTRRGRNVNGCDI